MISVLMCTYQSASTLERACRSILDGSYKDLELIVVDDGSTDFTPAVLEQLAFDPRLRAVRLEQNMGLTHGLNLALAQAKGAYIARMDADDVSHPDRLSKELTYLEAHPELGYVSCAVNLVEDGTIWGERHFPDRPTVDDLMHGNPYVHPGMLFRKEALDKVNGYRDIPQTVRCEDYDLVLRLKAEGIDGGNLPEVLLDYTERRDSSARHTRTSRLNECWVRRQAAKYLHWGPKGKLLAYKPLLLGMLPKSLYNRLHRGKWAK